jgi:hypothetical protein
LAELVGHDLGDCLARQRRRREHLAVGLGGHRREEPLHLGVLDRAARDHQRHRLHGDVGLDVEQHT